MEKFAAETIKTIYDRMIDDESRFIFMRRLEYFVDRDFKHLEDVVTYLDREPENVGRNMMSDLKIRYEKEPKDIVVYGAGDASINSIVLLGACKLKAVCLCDSDPSKHGTKINNLPVISPQQLAEEYKDAYIVISSYMYMSEIKLFLLDLGIFEDNIFCPGHFAPLYDTQYFLPEFKPLENEVFVDAGCYYGEATMRFVRFCGERGYKKIYCFEPDPDNFEKMLENMKSLDRISAYNKGVWSEETILPFLAHGSSSFFGESGDLHIPVVAIDDIVSDEHITFIKMDVEGSELEALHGAKNTIKKNKPRLAICIYHKPEDVLEIPIYIHQLVPDYKFYVRQHEISVYETVLYAVCQSEE